MMTLILFGVAFVLGLVVLTNVLPLLALAFTTFVALMSLKAFMKTDSTIAKLWWGSIVFVAVVITVSNIPAFIGLLAVIGLYMLYRNGKREEPAQQVVEADPFENFEKEWDKLMKN